LEARFDVRVRTLAAAIFIVWRLGWMATALYVPCLAIDTAFTGRVDLTTMIVTLGVLVTLYTMLGGIQAVIWNDVIQFAIMFAGLAATIWISITHGAGTLSAIAAAAGEAGRVTAPPAEYSTDKILPYFMSRTFPAGATGLVIAAILAASLSSIDSAINAGTSVVVIDFYRRLVLGIRGRDDAAGDEGSHAVIVSRV